MKVLITGAHGQVGRALAESNPSNIEVVAFGRDQLDVLDHQAIEATLERVRPDVVINAAAYTAVDKAEVERDRAFAINAEAVGAIAVACRAIHARLIHISTDFVFDGSSGRPYRPVDAPVPLSVYGASKLEGELRIAHTEGLEWIIVRTAWVYACKGSNFLLTMLRLMQERAIVRVVCDQIGTPTSARSLARMLWRVVGDTNVRSILHYTDAGVASWYDFAVAIREEAMTLGVLNRSVEVVPITAAEYPTPAQRPSFSVLDKSSTLARLDIEPVHWRVALREVLKELRS